MLSLLSRTPRFIASIASASSIKPPPSPLHHILHQTRFPSRPINPILHRLNHRPTIMTTPTPPVAERIPFTHVYHDRDFVDDYQWLRDDKRADPKVIEHLKRENEYAEALLADITGLKDEFYGEFLARLVEDDQDVPVKRGQYFYYERTVKGMQYPLYCRKPGSLGAEEEVYLDINVLPFEQKFLGGVEVSPDHKWAAYLLDTNGAEKFTLYIKNLETGEVLEEEKIEETYYSLEWGNDNRTVFYSTLDEIHRPYRIHRHILGTPVSEDQLVFQEDDKQFSIGLFKSSSERYLFIGASSTLTSEVHYLDADAPSSSFKVIQPREFELNYDVDHHDDHFIILTNRWRGEKYINKKLLRVPIGTGNAITQENWVDFVPYDSAIYITKVLVFSGFIVLFERSNASTRIRVLESDADRKFSYNPPSFIIDFKEPVYFVSSKSEDLEYHSPVIRFQYVSLVTPNSIYEFDVRTKERQLLKLTPVSGGYDPALYTQERIYADSVDPTTGHVTPVPVSLVYRTGLFKKDGSNPCHLYGYGSYGIPIDPRFESPVISLLDRGFVYAIGHIRGGCENGRGWYEEEGKFLKKKNTFIDFVAVAEALIEKKYTSKEVLSIEGRSAGGLLMGAVLNLRPELFKVAVAGVPFVDVINTMMDPSIPLTVGEYEEWGNPNDEKYFNYMLSYSPYNNLRRGEKYPNLLVRAGLNDPRVAYWEPAKWVAKLREYGATGAADDTDPHIIANITQLGAGHAGSSGRYDHLKDTALDYAFIAHYTTKSRP